MTINGFVKPSQFSGRFRRLFPNRVAPWQARMSGARPFRDVKLQWLQQWSCDRDLSDNARSVALYIVTTHLNAHTEKGWPSYQTIADATGKSVKTIQHDVGELEAKGWFEVQRGNDVGHNTEYRPSAASILRVSDARERRTKRRPAAAFEIDGMTN